MEQCKISKLSNNSTVSEFLTKKCVEENDLTGSQYSVYKNIGFKTFMLRSDLCDYSYVYIVVKWKKLLKVLLLLTEEIKSKTSRILLHLNYRFQKLITHLYTMQKMLILLCRCMICENIATIIL